MLGMPDLSSHLLQCRVRAALAAGDGISQQTDLGVCTDAECIDVFQKAT